jgi:type IV secretory pathway VirD2 relaxase
MQYIERAGATRDGQPGCVYSVTEDKADGRAFIERCAGDRHQFRLLVMPEDGMEYDDLKPLIRRFMSRMERDLDTPLEWVAADHYDTLSPHAHVVLRGRTGRGDDLIISPDYIRYGMQERFAGLVSLDLGPRDEFEPSRRFRREIQAERLIPLDCRLLREMDSERTLLAAGSDVLDHSIRIGRLHKLRALGLAEDLGSGRWRLADDLASVLHRIGGQADAAEVMQGALASAGLERAPIEQVVHPSGASVDLSGRLVAHGFGGDEHDRRYIIVDAVDGRVHYLDIARSLADDLPRPGAIVRVVSDATATRAIAVLSPLPLEQLVDHDGATWLDRELMKPQEQLRDHGFGKAVRSALEVRRNWLLGQGLATLQSGRISYRPDALAVLQRRELVRAADAIAQDTGLEPAVFGHGSNVEGVVRRRLDLACGRFAAIENGREFALVPWGSATRAPISGIMRRDGSIEWTFEQNHGLEI